MGRQLVVVLGAGASADLLGVGPATVNPNYAPPLTKQLFIQGFPLQPILEKYPGARSLAATIAARVRGGQTLEGVLRSMRDDPEPHVRRRFRQIPLYLQDLFGEISANYTSEPVNYTDLVGAVMGSQFDRVAFVTTNYDLFLEQALISVMGARFDTLGSYVVDPKWVLIKLHGSVNWAWKVTSPDIDARTDHRILESLDKLPIEDLDLRGITLIPSHLHRAAGDNEIYYPALSVPVDDKYEYVCPDEHVDVLKSVLATSPNLLVIGNSGRDQDLIEILKSITDYVQTACFVASADVEDVRDNFRNQVITLHRAIALRLHRKGFSDFMVGGGFGEYLSLLADSA